MSEKELKALEKRFKYVLDNELDQGVYNHYLQVKPHLDKLERDIALQNNSVNEKNYEWVKWLIVIAAGVFSVIVTQVSKMSSLSIEQLFLLKTALSLNALGIVLGAIYLYTDIRNGKGLIVKLQIQRYYLMLEGKERYQNVVHSDKLWFAQLCKSLCLISFLAVMIVLVGFVWQLQVDTSVMTLNP